MRASAEQSISTNSTGRSTAISADKPHENIRSGMWNRWFSSNKPGLNQSNTTPPQKQQEIQPDDNEQTELDPENNKEPPLTTLLRYNHESDTFPGYPRLASWLASDPCFALGRDNSDLRIRCRLYKQYKVDKIREELLILDKKLNNVPEERRNYNNSFELLESEMPGEFQDLMKRLDDALRELDGIQLREQAYRTLPRASRKDHTSVLNYLSDSRDLDLTEEKSFLYPFQMVSLAGTKTTQSWLDIQIEKILKYIPGSQKVFTHPERRQDKCEYESLLFDRDRIAILAKCIIVILAGALVFGPVAILTSIMSDQKVNLAVVGGAIVLFPLVISLCSALSHQEIFGFTAAYAAMLVVFLGNSLPQNQAYKCPSIQA